MHSDFRNNSPIVLGSLVLNYFFICKKKKKKGTTHIEMLYFIILNGKFTHGGCIVLCTYATLFVLKSRDFLYLA